MLAAPHRLRCRCREHTRPAQELPEAIAIAGRARERGEERAHEGRCAEDDADLSGHAGSASMKPHHQERQERVRDLRREVRKSEDCEDDPGQTAGECKT